MKEYDHKEIEARWQKEWAEKKLYKTEEGSDKPKCYVLDMFPYPSGEGLHVGHPKGYIATDVYSRYKRMMGHNVLHPMGWDAFGLPAEQFAIKNKVHPRTAVEKNTAYFKAQLAKIGFNYDWEREVNTTDPGFYKWTQWTFLKMFERGLAYESYEPINWCPSCQTGLANEDLDGVNCERCGTLVEKKPMRQWVLKITDYADRMLQDLDTLNWPESIKESQRNWIGRSQGSLISFALTQTEADKTQTNADGIPESLEVFTTRPDTLFGVTYLAISAELAKKWLDVGWQTSEEIKNFVEKTLKEEAVRAIDVTPEKEGIFTGVHAINPANQEKIPVWIANYVLSGYGTGAIMAVPAHDERDFQFACKYKNDGMQIVEVSSLPDGLNIKKTSAEYTNGVEHPSNWWLFPDSYQILDKNIDDVFDMWTVGESKCHNYPGALINSAQFDGMSSEEAKTAITEFVGGKMTSQYRLKDWVFSRQRYWGEPIPLVHCEKDGVVAVPEKDLPVTLPDVESYAPTGTGESPLADISEWVNTTCPTCGGPAKRETNTMPQWAGSSWYYLRFIDPKNTEALVDKAKEKYWSPVDMYVGGAEHATRHLIYARFWHKFLFDIGVVNYSEPFTRLQNVGLIMASDGRKMSKRYGNVINPDDIVETFGADALRLYEMFMGPFDQSIAWSTDNIVGARRFVERVWKLGSSTSKLEVELPSAALETLYHQTVKKVTDDIEEFKFNTAISQLMILLNAMEKEEKISQEVFVGFLKLLAPFAPHITEEIWKMLGKTTSIHQAEWPAYDIAKTISDTVMLAIQVNGKHRDTIEITRDLSQEDVERTALARPQVQKWLEGKTPKKIIYVPGKILNIVA